MTIKKLLSSAGLALLMLGCAGTMNDKYPATSADGLERIESKRMDAVYWKPGATLDEYASVSIAEVAVQFRKNWLRDQNSQRAGASNRINQQDMDNISAALGELFLEVFAKELESGGYNVVQENGDNVLVLKPEIVDLDVTAPDLSMRQANRVSTYTTSAGEMTLNMELYDSATRALIGRVIDRQQDRDDTFMTHSSSVTNRAQASRTMRRWAVQLREALDEAK